MEENHIIAQVRRLLKEYVDTHHGGVVRRAAKEFGMQEGALLSQWISGQRTPSLTALAPILEKMGVSLRGPTLDPVEHVVIPKVTARPGAGNELVIEASEPGFALRRELLQRQDICISRSVILEAFDDSMAPLIMLNDLILVDRSLNSQEHLREGKLYLVGFGENLLLKRVQRTPRGWLFVSQNADYAPIPVDSSALEQLNIYGQIRWFGRFI